MDTATLVAELEAGTLAPAEFTHSNHVRAAWHVLRQRPLRDAAFHFRDTLIAYVCKLGAQDKFHLTLTLAFMHLIHARMAAADENWEEFAARNPELFSDAKGLIAAHYSPARLAEGRQSFTEPDLAPLP